MILTYILAHIIIIIITIIIIIACQSLVMLLGSNRNGRLEVTRFSVPTTSGTVSVIQSNALCNTSVLTAPDSLNTCPNVWRAEVGFQRAHNGIVEHGASKFRSRSKRPRN